MSALLEINVVCVFSETQQAQRLAAVVAAALKEVEDLFRTRVRFERYLISETPIRNQGWAPVRLIASIWNAITGGSSVPRAEPWNAVSIGEHQQAFWQSKQGRFIDTVDPDKLLDFARDTASVTDRQPVVVIVDQKITPPEGWLYIIGKSYGPREDQAIISLVTLDPGYWNTHEGNPLGVIKQRLRASCASLIGELVGLKECAEPACYMYQFATEPESLDGMVRIGIEHSEQVPEVAGKGFSIVSGDPTMVQTVEQSPQSKGLPALA